MWLLKRLWLDDMEVVAEAVDNFWKQPDFKTKLIEFIEWRWLISEFSWIDDEVIREISKYRETHAIMFWAEISKSVFSQPEKHPWYHEIMWWIPEIDEECEWFPRSHEEAMRILLEFYFRKRK
jgi:hypothetical protein